MKRAHRRNHLIIWILLVPILLAILYLSLTLRPGEPVNEELPAELVEETADLELNNIVRAALAPAGRGTEGEGVPKLAITAETSIRALSPLNPDPSPPRGEGGVLAQPIFRSSIPSEVL